MLTFLCPRRIIVRKSSLSNLDILGCGKVRSMTTAIAQEFTLHLNDDLIKLVRQAATERQETPDQVVADALWFALQPIRREALHNLQQHIRQQQFQPEAEIRAHLDAHLTDSEQQRLTKIQERSKEQQPTAEDLYERQQLFDRIEAIATEKAAAIWLLSGNPVRPDTTL